ncbi:MAG: hypothetical protein M1823_001356 [Watsoniomyces obsoletus]|nr:MAG: hypothetical protein M1823_001356 [Watsoniomyces obsoletus]
MQARMRPLLLSYGLVPLPLIWFCFTLVFMVDAAPGAHKIHQHQHHEVRKSALSAVVNVLESGNNGTCTDFTAVSGDAVSKALVTMGSSSSSGEGTEPCVASWTTSTSTSMDHGRLVPRDAAPALKTVVVTTTGAFVFKLPKVTLTLRRPYRVTRTVLQGGGAFILNRDKAIVIVD